MAASRRHFLDRARGRVRDTTTMPRKNQQTAHYDDYDDEGERLFVFVTTHEGENKFYLSPWDRPEYHKNTYNGVCVITRRYVHTKFVPKFAKSVSYLYNKTNAPFETMRNYDYKPNVKIASQAQKCMEHHDDDENVVWVLFRGRAASFTIPHNVEQMVVEVSPDVVDYRCMMWRHVYDADAYDDADDGVHDNADVAAHGARDDTCIEPDDESYSDVDNESFGDIYEKYDPPTPTEQVDAPSAIQPVAAPALPASGLDASFIEKARSHVMALVMCIESMRFDTGNSDLADIMLQHVRAIADIVRGH